MIDHSVDNLSNYERHGASRVFAPRRAHEARRKGGAVDVKRSCFDLMHALLHPHARRGVRLRRFGKAAAIDGPYAGARWL
jgi:hypothetical protein